MGGWWRWALVSPDGVVPSWMVGVSASVNHPLHHKDQKFSSGIGSPGWSQKKGRKTVVLVVMVASKRKNQLLCMRKHSLLHRILSGGKRSAGHLTRRAECKAEGPAAECPEVRCRYDAGQQDASPCRTHPEIMHRRGSRPTTAC